MSAKVTGRDKQTPTLLQGIEIIHVRIVDQYALEVEIDLILGVEESRCYVRNILTGVTLAGDVNIISLYRKYIYEIRPESHKLCSDVVLIVHTYVSGGIPSTDRLVDINHICEIRPAVRVLVGLVSTRLPQKWS